MSLCEVFDVCLTTYSDAMDKAALQDLFAYTGWAWHQIKAAIPDDETIQAVAPGSGWPTLRNCLGHIVLAYDRWIPAIVDLETRPMPELAPGDFLAWSQIDAQRRRTRDPLQFHLEAWTDDALMAAWPRLRDAPRVPLSPRPRLGASRPVASQPGVANRPLTSRPQTAKLMPFGWPGGRAFGCCPDPAWAAFLPWA